MELALKTMDIVIPLPLSAVSDEVGFCESLSPWFFCGGICDSLPLSLSLSFSLRWVLVRFLAGILESDEVGSLSL